MYTGENVEYIKVFIKVRRVNMITTHEIILQILGTEFLTILL